MNRKEIKRDRYLNELIRAKDNGFVKIITGIRRCGKSYLLFHLYRGYLISKGIKEEQIIAINLDEIENAPLHDPIKLYEYIKEKITSDEIRYYLFIDEAQYAIIRGEKKDLNYNEFYFAMNSLLHRGNIDIYLSGSNSRFLSSDIKTEFRGRYYEIHLNTLSFNEFYLYKEGNELNKSSLFTEYLTYGGLPEVVKEEDISQKRRIINDTYDSVYYLDILERYRVERSDVLNSLVDILSSSIGGFTSPNKIYNTYLTRVKDKSLSINTINSYLNYLLDSFIILNIKRYDVKGRKELNSISKYYFSDIGIRNSRIHFNRLDINHLLENVVALEMLSRGYEVYVGVLPTREKNNFTNLEVDFVCRNGEDLYYLQVAQDINEESTEKREFRPLLNIRDNFTKILILYSDTPTYKNEDGIIITNIKDFLLCDDLKSL